MKQSNKKTTAIYCRTARKNSEEILLQQERLRNFSKQKSLGAGKVYSDNGYGGLDFNRPAFQTLRFDIEQGQIDTIVLKSLCRISRNYLETGSFLELCQTKKVLVYSLDCSAEICNHFFSDLKRGDRK